MLRKQWGFLTSSGDKIKNGLYVQKLLDAIQLADALASIKVPAHSKLDSLEARGNHLVDISAKNAALEGTNSQTSVMVKGMFPLPKW